MFSDVWRSYVTPIPDNDHDVPSVCFWADAVCKEATARIMAIAAFADRQFIWSRSGLNIQSIMERFQLNASKAKDLITKTDKKRASYYNYYTNKKWGDTSSYDLCINSGRLGVEGSALLIMDYLKRRGFLE